MKAPGFACCSPLFDLFAGCPLPLTLLCLSPALVVVVLFVVILLLLLVVVFEAQSKKERESVVKFAADYLA